MRRLLISLSAAAVCLLAPWWWRTGAPGPYFVGFAATIPAAALLVCWALYGFGVKNWWRQSAFLVPWVAFIVWSLVSTSWARFTEPSQEAALQLLVFALVVATLATVPIRSIWLIAGTLMSLILTSLITFGQVILQGPVGLRIFGEYIVRPGAKLSILTAEGQTYLRPYGPTAHPNMLGGFLTLAILLAAALFLDRRIPRPLMLATGTAILMGWAALLLTFSRSAWVGLVIGVLPLLVWLLRDRTAVLRRRVLPVMGGAVIILVLFVVAFRPFVFARGGIGDTSMEQRSVADRALFTRYTLRMIADEPILGVGIGMNDWESAQYIVVDPIKPDLAALPVHDVPLLILSETGLIGALLLIAALAGAALLLWQRRPLDIQQIGLLAAFLGIAGASLFDFYMWRQFPYVVLWFALLACALASSQPNTAIIENTVKKM